MPGPPDDPYDGRAPTSHERRAGVPWEASYRAGSAPWDIGEPQPAIVRLAGEGVFAGAVLDAGCGTGDNALHVASLGLSVLGIDVAGTAVAVAREKAAARGLDATFEVADALALADWHARSHPRRSFETVLDCGLLHSLDADERRAYVAGLAAITAPPARLHVLCFRDTGSEPVGPHPLTRSELEAVLTQRHGWRLEGLREEQIHASFAPAGLPAWLVCAERDGGVAVR